jgi:hypothetical protein
VQFTLKKIGPSKNITLSVKTKQTLKKSLCPAFENTESTGSKMYLIPLGLETNAAG